MKSRRIIVFLSLLAALCILVLPSKAFAAATKVTIDEDKYNLYTDNFPDPIGDDVYAKFTGNVSDVEEYYLNFDQDAAEASFISALDKNKVSYEEDYICYMKPYLYKYSDEGDDKSVTSQKVEIYFPLPMDAQEHPEDCSFYKLSSGKLTEVYPLSLYEIDDVYYIKMTLASSTDFSTIYGFVYTDPYSYEEEGDEDDWEDEDAMEEEDPDSFEEDDITSTATPSPAPTLKPTATPTPKLTPTPKPTGSGSSTNSGSSSSGKKDSIPKTGDDFPLYGILTLAGVALGVLIISVFKIKKN